MAWTLFEGRVREKLVSVEEFRNWKMLIWLNIDVNNLSFQTDAKEEKRHLVLRKSSRLLKNVRYQKTCLIKNIYKTC